MSKKFNYSSLAESCVKCGKCKSVCTIFKITKDETTSPRGFIDLLDAYNKGNLELDRNTKNIFESCFLCSKCSEACPNNIDVAPAIEQVRKDIAKKYNITWYKKAFFILLKHRTTMDILAKMGWVFQSCFLKKDKEKKTSFLRFPVPLVKKGRALTFADSKSFLKKYPENIYVEGDSKTSRTKQRVAIFIGCMSNYAYTQTGDALVKVLKKLDINIFIPKKQMCCGAPAYFTGDFNTVDYLIKKNIEYFETWINEVDAIIVPEATCSAMINHDWNEFLFDQPEWQERARKITNKVFLATKWLNDNTNLQEVLKNTGKQIETSITYHDSCHAKITQNVEKEPRNLLKQNFNIIEMKNPHKCCGFGGVTIQSEKFNLAESAGTSKAIQIKNTNAEIVSAECSACRMQISNSLHQEHVDVVFKNPIELIAEVLDDD